jgi:hypothetical protein
MNKKIVVMLALVSTPWNLVAETLYPKSLPPRYYGLDQVRSPSCQSEAEAHALEQAFANKGAKVMISSWHRNYKNWYGKDLTIPRIRPLTAEDEAIVKATPSLIPDFMYPAPDFRTGNAGGWRPNMSLISSIDTSFASDAATGFEKQIKSFETQDSGQPYSPKFDGRNTADLINAIRAGKAVTLSIHAQILSLFDHDTGLLTKRYDHDSFLASLSHRNESSEENLIDRYIEDARRSSQGWQNEQDLPLYASEKNHALAVVGYDSEFYRNEYPANPGALIVRNSWNEQSFIASSESQYTASQKAGDLERFRYPLYRAMTGGVGTAKNMPGYYALPMQYVQDMINFQWPNSAKRGVGEYYILEVAHPEVFIQAYNAASAQYTVMRIPFTCDKTAGRNKVSNYAFFLEEEPQTASSILATEARGLGATFRLAYLPVRNGDKSIVNRFLNGGFDDYFCKYDPDQTGFDQTWPGRYTIDVPEVWSTVEGISSLPNSLLSWSRYLRTMNDKGATKW